MVGSPHSVLGSGMPFDVWSASPLLQRNLNRNAGLVSVNVAVCFTRLPSPIIVDCYRYSGRIGIGRDMQTDVLYSLILHCREYSFTDV